MGSRVSAVELVGGRRSWLWVVGLLCFGVGDVVTTSLGLTTGHVAEVGPLVSFVVDHYRIGGLLALKCAMFGACYLLYRLLPSPQNMGVPLGLATVGPLVVGWNLLVLFYPV